MAAENNNTTVSMSFEDFVTPWNERVSCAILFSALCVIGITTNGIAIGLSVFTELRRHRVNLLIANLASSDLMCTGVFLFGQNFYILYRESLPEIGCAWLGFLNFIAAMQEFIFPPFLAINRYIGLYYSDMYERAYSTRNMFLMAAGSWSFSTCIPLIFFLTGHTRFDKANEHCCVVVEGYTLWTVLYWLIIIGPLVGMCDSTMVFCNWKIYKKLQEHVSHCGSMLKKNVVNDNREIMYFMLIDMLMPICAHSVYHISKFTLPNRFNLAERQFFTCLYLGNAGLRGIIILMMLRPYRKAFLKYIVRRSPSKVGTVATSASRPPGAELSWKY